METEIEMEKDTEMIEMEMEKAMEMERMKQKFEEFQEIMEAQKERENNGNEGGSTSTPSNSDTAQDTNAEEALISSVIEKLDDEEYISPQLCMIMDFLGGKTQAELNRLNHLIRKVVETALNLNNIMEANGDLHVEMDTYSVGDKLREIKMRMIKSGVSDREEKKALLVFISSVIQKLEHHHAEVCKHVGEIGDLKGVIDELRMILDFLSDKSLEEVRRLDWLICEAVEVALYVDPMVGSFYLWREATSIKSRLHGIKLRMLGSGVDGEEDPETLILLVIQQLHSQHARSIQFTKEVGDIKGVVNELRMILDFLREEKTVHNKYLICDLIEMALYLNEVKDTDYLDLCKEAESVQSWLREIRLRMLKSETETEKMRSEDVGEKGDEEDVVGLDEQVKLVLGRAIFNEGKGLETAAITGMVGIGKTSLARQIYNHATVVDRFERRAWVRVSGDLTHKEILMKLIQQVAVDSDKILQTDSSFILEEMDSRSLRHLLHDHLEGMPYLIVLDDLPKQMHLKSLLSAFPNDEGKGSRLLATSSTKRIQTAIWYTHLVKPLDSDKSWKLFLNVMFRGDKFSNEQKFPKHLEEKRREMLRKCGGLPLAIKEVALQLAERRRTGSEWEELLDSIDWGSTLALLENFYQQLEQEQKSFFLHLALFKENTTMRAEKLFNVLVAGGLVSESEMAASLGKLNSESIIDFKHVSGQNRVKSCDINVVLHRLSMKKAEEEIGFEVLSNNNANNIPSQTSPRHRIINCSREMFDYSTNQDEHLVSLFFCGGGHYLDATPSYWKTFELKLKILDLEDFGLKILPESIGTLIELRYLGLRNNYLKKLPYSLVCLKKLEVLDVAQNFMAEVPDIICDMSSLRRIYMSSAIFQKPLKIDTLKKLVTVMYISVNDLICELSSSQMMTSVEELGIKEEDGLQTTTSLNRLGIEEVDADSDVSKLFAALAELNALEHLVLRGYRFRSMPRLGELRVLRSLTTLRLEGLLAKLPSVDDFPPYLSYLRLVNTCLDEDPMPVLEQLHFLKHLKLKNAYTGRQMVITLCEWPGCNLEVLCIEELWNLRNIQVEKDAMPRFEKLEIKNCPYLETLPEEIGAMSGLQEFNMTTTKCIATKIRKSGSISKIRVVNINP